MFAAALDAHSTQIIICCGCSEADFKLRMEAGKFVSIKLQLSEASGHLLFTTPSNYGKAGYGWGRRSLVCYNSDDGRSLK